MRRSVGLIGCGPWGRLILRDLAARGIDVSVVDVDAKARTMATADGAAHVFTAMHEMDTVDALIVSTPATTHAEVTTVALERGVPVLLEKPFTTNLDDAKSLAQLGCNRLFVGHVWRYHPGVEMLGAIAQSGELGPVMGLKSVRANWTSPRTDVDSVWNLVPHDLTLSIEILGRILEPRAAVAEVHDGRVVGMTALMGEQPWQTIDASNRFRDKRREVRLHCRDGIAVMRDPDAGEIEIIKGNATSLPADARIERRPYAKDTALARQLTAFMGHVDGGPPPKSDANEGVATVAAVMALRALAGIA